MRNILAALAWMTLLPISALADTSGPPEFSSADQAQFAKLGVALGTFTCVDTPFASKIPHTVTLTHEGNFYVAHETGDVAATTYTGWDRHTQQFFSLEIDDNGDVTVSTTKSADPYNATWDITLPASTPKVHVFPYLMALTGNTMTITGQGESPNHQILSFSSVCTRKQ